MAIGSHIGTFNGWPVVDYPTGDRPENPAQVAWRIEDTEYEGGEIFAQRLAAFLAEPWAGEVTTLIVGNWGSTYDTPPPMDLLIDAAGQLTSLRALFLGELTYEECEISWICHANITPLLTAYPHLETFTVRGSQGLSLDPIRHSALRALTVQSGGLPATVVRSVEACDLPELTHLELWLGTDNYGGDATVEDMRQILAGTRFPHLTSLGIRDAEIADQVAAALASAPVVARLEVLDLSLGMISDVGASALLTGQPLTHLRRLDLSHHFLSAAMMARLAEELGSAGVDVDLSDANDSEDEDERYIAVSE